MSRFDDFWAVWPSNKGEYTRKVNKAGCKKKWEQHKLDSVADAIIADVQKRVKYDKAWVNDGGKFIPMPMTYLSQRRWEDGDFADVRDDRKPKAVPVSKPQDDGIRMSKYARGANRILMEEAYMNSRGFNPLGEPLLAKALETKNRIVRDAETDAESGSPWSDQEFISLMREKLREVLSTPAGS